MGYILSKYAAIFRKNTRSKSSIIDNAISDKESLSKNRLQLCNFGIRSDAQKFATLDYMADACYCNCQFRDVLTYALQQRSVADSLDNNDMRKRAHVNLSAALERLGEYYKCVSYCRVTIKLSKDSELYYCQSFLIMGRAYYGLGVFEKAAECWSEAWRTSQNLNNIHLEASALLHFGQLFASLNDIISAYTVIRRAVIYLQGQKKAKTKDLQQICRTLLEAELELANIILHLGYTQEASGLVERIRLKSTFQSDAYAQAICLHVEGNILRQKGYFPEAINSFANARNAFEQMGFRARVALVNASMASQALASPDIIYQADAIKYLEEAVEIATTIKAKYLQIRLHSLYCQLIMKQNLNNDLNVHINAMEILSDQAGLICHYCGNLLGDQIESIEILPCSHIYHYKCVRDGLSKSIKTPQRCIKCSKLYVLNEGMLSLKQIDVFDFIPFNHCRSNSRY